MRASLRIVAVVLAALGVGYLQVEPIRWSFMLMVLAPLVWWYGSTMHEWKEEVGQEGCVGQIAVVLQALLVTLLIGAAAVYMANDVLTVWFGGGA